MVNNHTFSCLIQCFAFLICVSYGNNLIAGDTNTINSEVYSNTNLKENEEDINNQLNDYKSVSNWIYNNQDKFKEILEETAKKSKTRWIIDDSRNNANQVNTNSDNMVSNVQENNNSLEESLYHVVKKGETLYFLSKMYNVKVEDIVRINNLNINTPIKEGQRLLVSLHKENQNLLNNSNSISNNKYSAPYKVIVPNKYTDKNSITSIQNNESEFDWPVVGRLLINFGPQKNGLVSEGINIMAKAGSNVKTISSGVVIYVGRDIKALGNIILIQHKGGWVSVYGYLGSLYVKKGEEVKRGTIIATVAKLSNLKVSQLHFELRQNITPKDPLEYLNSYT